MAKPTKQEMENPAKWIDNSVRQPATETFYAVKQRLTGNIFWLMYTNGRWSHGTYLGQHDDEESALYNVRVGAFIGQTAKVFWFDHDDTLGLFDYNTEE